MTMIIHEAAERRKKYNVFTKSIRSGSFVSGGKVINVWLFPRGETEARPVCFASLSFISTVANLPRGRLATCHLFVVSRAIRPNVDCVFSFIFNV